MMNTIHMDRCRGFTRCQISPRQQAATVESSLLYTVSLVRIDTNVSQVGENKATIVFMGRRDGSDICVRKGKAFVLLWPLLFDFFFSIALKAN